MICCEKCFIDIELVGIIKSIGNKGHCSICDQRNSEVYVYDTDKDDELSTYLTEFISIFLPVSMMSDFSESKMLKCKLLRTEVRENWGIFKDKTDEQINMILATICKEKYVENPQLFNEVVGLPKYFSGNDLEKHSLLKTADWETFVDSLIKRNRFHTKYFNVKLFEELFSFIRKEHVAEKSGYFYRCRIANNPRGFKKSEMSAPPFDKAKAGRISAEGIPCLYLGDSLETVIAETRPRASDYITIGKFKLKKDILVVDLKGIKQVSPFIGKDLHAKVYAYNKPTLNKIDEELGKPMRTNDSDLDYIPAQFIADFIKNIERNGQPEYSGVEYSSVMRKNGYNLAVFDPYLFECVDTKTYKIGELEYKKEECI